MRYRFAHFLPEIFADLQHGVNALAHRADAQAGPSPAGSTVVLGPGDELETKTAYVHPHLELLDDALTEAGALLASVGKGDIETTHDDALRAERSAEGSVIVEAATEGHDAQLPGSNLVDPAVSGATDVAADPTAIAAVDTTTAPPAPAPAPAPVVETPAAPVVEAPVQPAPAAEVPVPPAAPVVEAPAAS